MSVGGLFAAANSQFDWPGKMENGVTMSVPSKANIGKLDNPARLKINHQAVTAPGV